MASPLKDSIPISSYPLVPPFIYRATASLSFPLLNDSTWRSTVPQSLRLRYVREFISTLGNRSLFYGRSKMRRSAWKTQIAVARRSEEIYFYRSQDENVYHKTIRRSLEAYQRRCQAMMKSIYEKKIRVRTLTELAYMKMWEGASEEVKEKASAPSDDPVRLLLREIYNEEETTSEPFAKRKKLND